MSTHKHQQGARVETILKALFHWTTWTPVLIGAGMLLSSELLLKQAVWQNLLSALGSLLISAGLVGSLLNAVWWRTWTTETLVAAVLRIFSDRELLARMMLDRRELRERIYVLLGAAFGAPELTAGFKTAFDRDVLGRLELPVRRNLNVAADLREETHTVEKRDVTLARLTRETSLQLQNFSQEQRAPFAGGIVLTGFVEVPMLILDALGAGGAAADAPQVMEMAVRCRLFEFGALSIGGEQLEPDRDFSTVLTVDLGSVFPSILFQVRLTRPGPVLEPESVMDVQYVTSQLHERSSYHFQTMAQLTEGARISFSWPVEKYTGNLRLLVPPYWESRECRIIKPISGSVVAHVHSVLLPGHGVMLSWLPVGSHVQETASRAPAR